MLYARKMRFAVSFLAVEVKTATVTFRSIKAEGPHLKRGRVLPGVKRVCGCPGLVDVIDLVSKSDMLFGGGGRRGGGFNNRNVACR
jgi:hypothetical protein